MTSLAAAREIEPADPEIRAPAPLRVATLLEQTRQVRQAVWSERLDVKSHVTILRRVMGMGRQDCRLVSPHD
jgi:hypothetical protein